MFLKNIRKINKSGTFLYFKCVQFSDYSRMSWSVRLVNTILEESKISSVQDWKNVRKAILTHESNRGVYTENNIDSVLLNYCVKNRNVNDAVLYFSFMDQEGIKKNLAILGKYFNLLYLSNEENYFKKGQQCSQVDEERIIKNYNDLRRDYPVLDPFTLENVIPALSITKLWKICIDLLNEIKISAEPNALTYSTVVAAAFLHGEEKLAWDLLLEMISADKAPNDIIFLSYLAFIRKMKTKENGYVMEKLEKLFNFFQEYNIKCNEEFIKYLLKDVGNKNSNFVKVNYKGDCSNCQMNLQKFDITSEQFEELKNQILENVLIGKNVFVKTTPEEVDKFKSFIQKMDRYDVVLDGLNVAYSVGTKHSPQVYSALLSAVVSYFIQQNKKILLLGRVHMTRWPKQNWNFIKNNTTIFLTQNTSQDDPYLLYCALNSGKDTIIVTKDLMRGHKFLLKDPHLKMLFNRWLSLRQYKLVHVDKKGKPLFKKPPPFSEVAQKNGNNWHIPYREEGLNNDNESYHKTWFCLKC